MVELYLRRLAYLFFGSLAFFLVLTYYLGPLD